MTTQATLTPENPFRLRQQSPEEETVRPHSTGPLRLGWAQASQWHTGAAGGSPSDFLGLSTTPAGPHPPTIASDQSP